MKNEKEVDPDELETSPGLQVTSPNALVAKPAGYIVGSEGPGQPPAPTIAVEAPTTATARVPEVGGESAFGMNAAPERGGVVEYRQPATRLPDAISAREIANDRSNPDGCQAFEVQR
jgi:hypothetical protein